MPYIRKGKCVFRQDTGKKVGCSKTIPKSKAYLKALYNAEVDEDEETFDNIVARMLDSMPDVVIK